jgi:hypothetical protein
MFIFAIGCSSFTVLFYIRKIIYFLKSNLIQRVVQGQFCDDSYLKKSRNFCAELIAPAQKHVRREIFYIIFYCKTLEKTNF